MKPTPEQQEALDAFAEFLDNPEHTLFCLFGAAGCGKSFTAGHMYKMMEAIRSKDMFPDDFLWLAPTWKAARVASRFLDTHGAQYEISYDPFLHTQGELVVTTTAQALGIMPVIKEDQTDKETGFGESGKDLIRKLKPQFVVIDEVSMLSWDHLKRIKMIAQDVGCKVLIIGDPGQLPPVKAAEIKWDKLPNRFELKTVMRQASDSAIPLVANSVRNGESSWESWSSGSGIVRVPNVANAFLENAEVPTENEADRTVYVAYRNALVDRVQEAACQKVYGHSATDFAAGEFVIAQSALHARGKGMLVANQDELKIIAKHGQGVWGERVEVRLHSGRHVVTEYISGKDMANPRHPYKVELDRRRDTAIRLQARWKGGERQLDNERRQAWKSFFELKDQTVLNFAHPFAITSHKSQGSTYKNAFVQSSDIAQFDERGLYVGMTRPSTQLFY